MIFFVHFVSGSQGQRQVLLLRCFLFPTWKRKIYTHHCQDGISGRLQATATTNTFQNFSAFSLQRGSWTARIHRLLRTLATIDVISCSTSERTNEGVSQSVSQFSRAQQMDGGWERESTHCLSLWNSHAQRYRIIPLLLSLSLPLRSVLWGSLDLIGTIDHCSRANKPTNEPANKPTESTRCSWIHEVGSLAPTTSSVTSNKIKKNKLLLVVVGEENFLFQTNLSKGSVQHRRVHLWFTFLRQKIRRQSCE